MIKYDVSQDYNKMGGVDFSSSPDWCVAIFRLGRPVSYSRKEKKSLPGSVVDGALLRKEQPLIIRSDIVNMSISGNKNSCVENLNCVLKGSRNYLSADTCLTGDWVFAWIHTNPNDTDRIIKALLTGQPANDFNSGLKFVGRIHSIRKHKTVTIAGTKSVQYTLQAVGFEELNTSYFYDPALSTLAEGKDIWQFMAQIGLDSFNFLSESHQSAGTIQDNSEEFFDKFLDIVVGEGSKAAINEVGQDVNGNSLAISPQQQREAPYAYLVPMSVANTLGRSSLEQRKGNNHGHQSYGYADILTTVTGVQQYKPEDPLPEHKGFVPQVDFTKSPSSNRLRCLERIKGTFIPIEPVFINTPLWSLLNQFKNPTINEMYTCLRPNLAGDIMPTIVFRQIPFSTNVIVENDAMPLTRFLSLPRWHVPNELIVDEDIGRSSATRFNFIHVYGQVSPYFQKEEFSITAQMTRNAPIMDGTSVAVHGFRPYMSTVACSITDASRKDGARVWMEALADWTMGSEHTLNGTFNCKGIQSPITKGDNIQVENVVYHIESVSHNCGMHGDFKFFNTTIQVSNGMPEDQSKSENAPVYPGFSIKNENAGNDKFNTNSNPGYSLAGK
jgi:hypothetical protein